MARVVAGTDLSRRVVLHARVRRAYWSRRRAWPGDTVQLCVETRNVPDGTKLAIAIWEDDTDEGSPDDHIATLDPAAVKDNRCTVDYQIDWDDAALGHELELEGESLEFVFVVTIERFGLTARSTRLYVPLEPLRVSA